jgi:hypothetical protein
MRPDDAVGPDFDRKVPHPHFDDLGANRLGLSWWQFWFGQIPRQERVAKDTGQEQGDRKTKAPQGGTDPTPLFRLRAGLIAI